MTQQGTSINDLFKDNTIKSFTLRHGGKDWTFQYREVSWQDHFQAVEVGWEPRIQEDGSSELIFNAAKYYENLFMLSIVSGPGGQPVTRMELRQLHPDVIGQLTQIVPSPKLTREVGESKKESESSSTEEKESSTSGSEPESSGG